MVKLLVHGYCLGVRSSRKLAQRLDEDVAFRALAAGNRPNFRTISDFRKIHLQALEGLFEQVLRLALESGALKLGRVALDGTKVKANAGKHRAMSAKRIREAKKALTERARERAAEAGEPDEQARKAKPRGKDQYNFTDPESRIMKAGGGFEQAYNAQAAVEPAGQLIVGQTLTNETNDKRQLQPLVEAVEEQAGRRPTQVLADSGYCSEQNLEYLASEQEPEKAIRAWVAVEEAKRNAEPVAASRERPPAGLTRVDRMRRKLRTKAGKKVYARRKAIVEPVFGQIRQARGIRQFLMRGLEKARGEWGLICATHNISKLHRMVTA